MADTGKIKRQFMAHYINASTTKATPDFVRLGKDLEEYIVEMNANVETKINILGENSTSLTGYEPQASIEPYYAEIGEPMFVRLQKIVDERQTLDDLKTETLEVHTWETPTSGKYVAYKEDGIIEVVSYGGDTTGYQIPFNVHSIGNRIKGLFDPAAKTFTADTGTV